MDKLQKLTFLLSPLLITNSNFILNEKLLLKTLLCISDNFIYLNMEL